MSLPNNVVDEQHMTSRHYGAAATVLTTGDDCSLLFYGNNRGKIKLCARSCVPRSNRYYT